MRLVPNGDERTPAPPDRRPAASPESPSLFAAGDDGPPAFELKFLLPEPLAREVEARVARRLALDPHADPARGNAYPVTSLYTDTPALEVLSRVGTLARRKFRVRQYGPAGPLFAERKTKSGDRVRKRRTPITETDLDHLAEPVSPPDWPANWFHRQLLARRLRPVCRIAYDRVAYTGAADGGVARATFDRRVRGAPATGWAVGPVDDAPALLDGQVIAEFKFRSALPVLFKEIVRELGLTPGVVSKYRLFMQTARPAPSGEGGG